MCMKDSQILSTFTPPAAKAPASGASGALVFDACHVGVVLRAVLFVEVVLGAGTLFMTTSPRDWLTQVALFTGGVLPATLLWLVTACSLKTGLARLPRAGQYGVGVVLGAVAGLLGCALLAGVAGGGGNAPWLASAVGRAVRGGAGGGAGLQLCARPRPAPQPGCPSCRRASGRIFCSTHSTAPSPWCAPNRPAPKRCWKT